MSYLVLARKWRPQTFQDVVAQRNAIQALQNAIRLKRLPHALLLCGSRGIGKTTIARLVAKTINCQNRDPENDDPNIPAEPCNQCSMCKEITDGRATDVIEIDGASNRSIDDIRDLRENVQYLPTTGRRKVYIIDEVHMLTREAFNALLKTLEEPPAHVLFTFATTEPHKIPITILSRCQRFDLKRITLAETVEYLGTLAEREGITLSDTARMMIARAADGGMRDALSLMDQVIAFGGEAPTDEQAAQAIGAIDRALLHQIGGALLNRDIAAALQCVEELFSFAYDLRQLTQELASFLRDLMVACVCQNPGDVIDLPLSELDAIKALADGQAPDRIQQMFRILTQAAEDIAHANHPRLLLEMTLIQMARLEPIRPFDEVLQQLNLLENRIQNAAEHAGENGDGEGGGNSGNNGSGGNSGNSGGSAPGNPGNPGNPGSQSPPSGNGGHSMASSMSSMQSQPPAAPSYQAPQQAAPQQAVAPQQQAVAQQVIPQQVVAQPPRQSMPQQPAPQQQPAPPQRPTPPQQPTPQQPTPQQPTPQQPTTQPTPPVTPPVQAYKREAKPTPPAAAAPPQPAPTPPTPTPPTPAPAPAPPTPPRPAAVQAQKPRTPAPSYNGPPHLEDVPPPETPTPATRSPDEAYQEIALSHAVSSNARPAIQAKEIKEPLPSASSPKSKFQQDLSRVSSPTAAPAMSAPSFKMPAKAPLTKPPATRAPAHATTPVGQATTQPTNAQAGGAPPDGNPSGDPEARRKAAEKTSLSADFGHLHPDLWRSLVAHVKQEKQLLSGPLETARYIAITPGEVLLLHRNDQGMLHDTISKPFNTTAVEQLFAEMGTPLKLKFKLQAPKAPTEPNAQISLQERKRIEREILIDRLTLEATEHPRIQQIVRLAPGTKLAKIVPLAKVDASTDNAN